MNPRLKHQHNSQTPQAKDNQNSGFGSYSAAPTVAAIAPATCHLLDFRIAITAIKGDTTQPRLTMRATTAWILRLADSRSYEFNYPASTDAGKAPFVSRSQSCHESSTAGALNMESHAIGHFERRPQRYTARIGV